MTHRFIFVIVLVALLCGLPACSKAAEPATMPVVAAEPIVNPFGLALGAADLDPHAYQAWFDGAEHQADHPADVREAIQVPGIVTSWNGASFGDSHNPGVRHLRYGFTRPVAVGTIISYGNCSVSVLKPEAAYPGKLDDDSQWLPLERIKNGKVVSDELHDDGEIGVWVLPPDTTLRAVRFSHIGQPTDRTYCGIVKAAYLATHRLVNIAPQGKAIASVHDDVAYKLINERTEGDSWDNCLLDPKGNNVPTPGLPWVIVYWPRPVQLCGINIQAGGCSALEVQAYVGPENRHPREASEADWRQVRSADNLTSWYPRALGMEWLDFKEALITRALRIRLTKPMDEQKEHPHMQGRTMGGRRFFAGEIMAFSPAARGPLTASVLAPEREPASAKPPLAIPFTLKNPGVVTLVIEDAQGKRIRNLISDTPFPAGHNIAYWDGMDDLGRDVESSRHGLYHVPGQFVAPGEYKVRGLVRKPLSLKYEFTAYYDGTPGWETADTSGGWLTNHTPPNCALFLPGDKTPNKQPMVYLGSHVAEGGAGLAWVNMDGRKIGGRMWVGGVFTGAQYICADAGANADPNVFMYVGSVLGSELRLTGLTKNQDKPILKWNFAKEDMTALNGIASYNGLLVCSLPKLNQLLFVDAQKLAVIGTVPMTDPHGVLFDSDGSLLVLTGTKLVRFPAPGMQVIQPAAAKDVITSHLDDP
ncbi:MAG: hypothetical protein WCI73_11580, partial [Phycisphaerae bacterium]